MAVEMPRLATSREETAAKRVDLDFSIKIQKSSVSWQIQVTVIVDFLCKDYFMPVHKAHIQCKCCIHRWLNRSFVRKSEYPPIFENYWIMES